MRTTTLALVTALAAQAPAPVAFEVASIRPSAEITTQASVGVRISGSQVRIGSLSLKDYVAIAYRVRITQVAGPDWLGQERFDIAAKIPDGVPQDRVADMLQALLAERFQMKVHRESKEFPVFAIAVAKGGLKLQEAPASDDAPSATVNTTAFGNAQGVSVDLGAGSFFSLAGNRIEGRRITMAALANMLNRFMDRTVIDGTGLTGRYDLALDLAPEDYTAMLIRSAINAGVVLPPQALRAMDAGAADPLSPGLAKYGLTLESRRAPLDVIVVDAASKAPTEN